VPIPVAYLIGAVALGFAVPALDRTLDVSGDHEANLDTARDILTSTATGMIAFTGLVIASVLVVVQFAASQYSPRLVLWFRGQQLPKHAIGSFLAAWVYALVALRELEKGRLDYAPDLTVRVGLVVLVAAAVLFLLLLERVMDGLRPRGIYEAVGREGARAARAVYPTALGEEPDAAAWRSATVRHAAPAPHTGVIASFGRAKLVETATAGDVVVELAHGVGEFVAHGAPLVRVHGDGPVDETAVARAIDVADERTIRQDPAFGLRIIVDTAIRALSPAVNDPTTAVHALDSLEVLVRDLAGRDLEAPVARGPDGAVRVAWPAPRWPDVLDLAFDEIRAYGASSVQICRRLRAVLEDLRAATPPVRHAALDEQLARLDAAVDLAFPEGSPERELALRSDRLGLGLDRGR
jgi:uncharacterized membrane protein